MGDNVILEDIRMVCVSTLDSLWKIQLMEAEVLLKIAIWKLQALPCSSQSSLIPKYIRYIRYTRV